MYKIKHKRRKMYSKICEWVFKEIDKLPEKYRYGMFTDIHLLQVFSWITNIDRDNNSITKQYKYCWRNSKLLLNTFKKIIKIIKKKERDKLNNSKRFHMRYMYIEKLDEIDYLQDIESLNIKNINIVKYNLLKDLFYYVTQWLDSSYLWVLHTKFALLKQAYSVKEQTNLYQKEMYKYSKRYAKIHWWKEYRKTKEEIFQEEIDNILKNKEHSFKQTMRKYIEKYEKETKNNYLWICWRSKWRKNKMYQYERSAHMKDMIYEFKKVSNMSEEEIKLLIEEL